MYKMSSTLRKFSQIPVRTKYLLGILAGADGGNNTGGDLFGTAGASVIVIDPSVVPPPVATTTGLTNLIGTGADAIFTSPDGPTNYLVGKLFKDMGRQVTVYDDALPGSLHIATYRECQLVSGSGSEGVVDSSPYYVANLWVRVWAADGTGVSVARTG